MRQAAHSETLNNSLPLGVTRVLSLLTPIKPINIQSPYGGPEGSRTPVQNTFLFASYSNNFDYIFIFCIRQPVTESCLSDLQQTYIGSDQCCDEPAEFGHNIADKTDASSI